MSLEVHLAHLAKRVDDLEATVKRLMDGLADLEAKPSPLAALIEDIRSKVTKL